VVKLDVTLGFPNPALYEDFLEAAEAEGLTPGAYLMMLVDQELSDVERVVFEDSPDGSKGGSHADTDG
jgi:hypothetical protein